MITILWWTMCCPVWVAKIMVKIDFTFMHGIVKLAYVLCGHRLNSLFDMHLFQ